MKKERDTKDIRYSLSSKISTIVFVSIFSCVFLIGWLTYNVGKAELQLGIKDSLEKIVVTTSLFLDGDSHQAITSYDSQEYRDMQAILLGVQAATGLEAPLYTLRRSANRNEAECVVTTEPVDFMGAKYKMNNEMRKAFIKGLVVSTDVYETENGIWVSAYAPIRNKLNKVVAILKIQRHVDYIKSRLMSRIIVTVFFCAIAFIIGLIISTFLIKRITANIKKLNKAATALSEGDYNSEIDVRSSDEIGQLAITLDNMRVSLNNKIKELNEIWLKEKKAHLESILTLSKAIEIRNPYTRGHIERVSHYSMLIAKKAGIGNEDIERLRYGCVLHDLGKLGINIDILDKPSKLDFDERSKMKMHTLYGAEIMKGVDFLDTAREISLYHHERFDGRGYPFGLRGESIPIFARIVYVADAFDAMVTDRPYRKRLSDEEAFSIISSEAGKQFDPNICYIFFEIKEEILKIRGRFK